MSRNAAFILIAVLGIAAGGLGYYFYDQQQRRSAGIDLSIGGRGVTIQPR